VSAFADEHSGFAWPFGVGAVVVVAVEHDDGVGVGFDLSGFAQV
jgi:hypothetical protein